MGPNGSGKSTLSYVIAGKADYDVTEGEVLLDGENILEMDPEERAAAGMFLAFQYPVEIPGVATMTFLKASLNAQRRARGEGELSTPDFMRTVREAAAKLQVDPEMLKRPLNVGFSGRREEAHGNPADGAAAAALRPSRRDRFRPRHRCASDRGRGRERAAGRQPRVPGDHPLPAPARLHHAGRRPRHVARAASSRRAAPTSRSNSRRTATATMSPKPREASMSADITRINTAAEAKLIDQFKSAHGSVAGDPRRPARQGLGTSSPRPACRTAASRPGTTPTCAPSCATPMPPAPAPDAATLARAQALARLAALPRAPALVLLDGHFVAGAVVGSSADGVTVRSLLDVLGEGPSAAVDQPRRPGRSRRRNPCWRSTPPSCRAAPWSTIAAGRRVGTADRDCCSSLRRGASRGDHDRSLVQAGAQARGRWWSNGMWRSAQRRARAITRSIVAVGDGATLDHVVPSPAHEAGGRSRSSTLVAKLGADANFTSFALVTRIRLRPPAGLRRLQRRHTRKGTLRGVSLLDGDGHADTTLVVTHKAHALRKPRAVQAHPRWHDRRGCSRAR